MPSMAGIVGHAPAIVCDVLPVLFLLWSKMSFSPPPHGRHVAPINVKFGTGSGPQKIWHGGPQVRSPVPNFTFIEAEMWKYNP